MSNWQSIETAPVDGKFILIWGGAWRHPWAGVHEGDGWVWLDNADASQTRMHATHWQPLPAPPSP